MLLMIFYALIASAFVLYVARRALGKSGRVVPRKVVLGLPIAAVLAVIVAYSIMVVNAGTTQVVITFDTREVPYDFAELDRIVLAYATTIHKAQGSEYPAVIMPLTTQHYPMLQRNLLYTGITRGKQLVVLVGQHKALALAVRNADSRRRWSKLRDWLSA